MRIGCGPTETLEELEALPELPNETFKAIKAYFADVDHPAKESVYNLWLDVPLGLGQADYLAGFMRDVNVFINDGRLEMISAGSEPTQIIVCLPAIAE